METAGTAGAGRIAIEVRAERIAEAKKTQDLFYFPSNFGLCVIARPDLTCLLATEPLTDELYVRMNSEHGQISREVYRCDEWIVLVSPLRPRNDRACATLLRRPASQPAI